MSPPAPCTIHFKSANIQEETHGLAARPVKRLAHYRMASQPAGCRFDLEDRDALGAGSRVLLDDVSGNAAAA
jgi:hypothetical protein